ncbi:hypothetical protein ACH9DO_14890 [Kocuria sp. M1N1S27]|uniref:hypothetical protein n=1 Tax=Kocuria kalidii TaxID=3376283 RepID=UPI0037A9ADA3
MSLIATTAPTVVVTAALQRAGLDPLAYIVPDIAHDLRDATAMHLTEAVGTDLFLRIARDNTKEGSR